MAKEDESHGGIRNLHEDLAKGHDSPCSHRYV